MHNFGRGMWRRVGDFERIQKPILIEQSRLEQWQQFIQYQNMLKKQQNMTKQPEITKQQETKEEHKEKQPIKPLIIKEQKKNIQQNDNTLVNKPSILITPEGVPIYPIGSTPFLNQNK
jgi:hypothetical protein